MLSLSHKHKMMSDLLTILGIFLLLLACNTTSWNNNFPCRFSESYSLFAHPSNRLHHIYTFGLISDFETNPPFIGWPIKLLQTSYQSQRKFLIHKPLFEVGVILINSTLGSGGMHYNSTYAGLRGRPCISSEK